MASLLHSLLPPADADAADPPRLEAAASSGAVAVAESRGEALFLPVPHRPGSPACAPSGPSGQLAADSRAVDSLLSRLASLEARVAQPMSTLEGRLRSLEVQALEQTSVIDALQADTRELKCRILEMDLAKAKAHSAPLSFVSSEKNLNPAPASNLLTVLQLEGFEDQIAHCISPCTGNRRFAGKVGWNKLRKTCRSLRAVQVSLEMDPSVRIVPDNFPTIRRAIQNIDMHDKGDHAKVLVRSRPGPYIEQVVIDRRVTLMADPTPSEIPVIHGRISIGEGAGGTVVRRLAVSNNNPRDPWGSAIDVNGAKSVFIEDCKLFSFSNDETVLTLNNCVATVRNNVISGSHTHGVIGISIVGSSAVTVVENTIVENHVGIYVNPTATVRLKMNLIQRNYNGLKLNVEDIDVIADEGGFGQIMLNSNRFVENRDGRDDESFLKSLELLLHPLLRRQSTDSFPKDDDGPLV